MSAPSTPSVPSLTRLLNAAFENNLRTVFAGWLPGKVQSYDANKRTATVELLVKDSELTRDGNLSVVEFAILKNVPVQFPGRASGALIEWTPAAGDKLIVMFCARPLGRHLQNGDLVDPDSVMMYDINDAVALPVADFDQTHVKSSNPQIKYTATEIQAGGVSPLALNADLNTVITKVNALITAMNTHTHPAPGGTTFVTVNGQIIGLVSNMTGTGKLKGG